MSVQNFLFFIFRKCTYTHDLFGPLSSQLLEWIFFPKMLFLYNRILKTLILNLLYFFFFFFFVKVIFGHFWCLFNCKCVVNCSFFNTLYKLFAVNNFLYFFFFFIFFHFLSHRKHLCNIPSYLTLIGTINMIFGIPIFDEKKNIIKKFYL